jgi:hypothetical protein
MGNAAECQLIGTAALDAAAELQSRDIPEKSPEFGLMQQNSAR